MVLLKQIISPMIGEPAKEKRRKNNSLTNSASHPLGRSRRCTYTLINKFDFYWRSVTMIFCFRKDFPHGYTFVLWWMDLIQNIIITKYYSNWFSYNYFNQIKINTLSLSYFDWCITSWLDVLYFVFLILCIQLEIKIEIMIAPINDRLVNLQLNTLPILLSYWKLLLSALQQFMSSGRKIFWFRIFHGLHTSNDR